MDAERYARIRELFLAVDELPRSQQEEFLRSQCVQDQELIDEVMSLLSEHDIESARAEGASAKSPTVSPIQADNARVSKKKEDDCSNSSSVTPPFLPDLHQNRRSGPGVDSPSSEARAINKRKRKRSEGGRSGRPESPGLSQATLQSAQRTHASPRYRDDLKRAKKSPSVRYWQTSDKRDRRFNSSWLWLAAVLPTAMIGWWTYGRVYESLRNATAKELSGVADTVRISVSRFLDDQSRLTQSWTRQPALRDSINALVEIANMEDSAEALRQSPHASDLRGQMIEMSQQEDIKYVVWDRTGTIIGSWLANGADVGETVAPDGAANLASASRGETVLFGPEVLRDDGGGFTPETDLPVMAEIQPIYDPSGQVVATMLIRGFGMFENFDAIFRQASDADGFDVYAVNRSGIMVTNSPSAMSTINRLADEPDYVACRLRVSDPGESSVKTRISEGVRRSQQLTYAAAGASSGRPGSLLDEYHNYAGIEVVGVWRWVEDWDLGIVVERKHSTAFETASIVGYSFLGLTLLLTLTELTAASLIAKRMALSRAAAHPLSRYELVSELGSGGMGVVYHAKHSQLGRDTALKVLRGDRDNLEDRLRFDREAKLAASLGNPHTVTIYDYGRGDKDEAYCVMEYLKGITLYDVVARSGFQPYGRTLFILRQICDSLAEAHQLGLVHRDVKPQNVMLSMDASVGDWAVVFDFGLAKPLRPDADSYQTLETIWAGTPMYMAPERYRDPNSIDPRSDIYSVGCIAYFLLSGRPPFIECDPESLFALVLTEQPISIGVHRDADVPADIIQVVQRSMAKSVDDRFDCIDDLAQELDKLISVHPWTVEEARSWWRIHGSE